MNIVRLSRSHICIAEPLATAVFKNQSQALWVYDVSKKRLLISGVNNRWFSKIHRAQLLLLKSKNTFGEKALSVRHILIDYGLKDDDRHLAYELKKKARILKIMF